MGAAGSTGAALSELEKEWAERRMLASDMAQICEDERERRIASGFVAPREIDAVLSAMQTELVRRVGRALVLRLAEQERAERIEAEAQLDREEELARMQAASAADAAADAEQAARAAAPAKAAPRGLHLVHTALLELFRFRTLRADVAAEAEARMQSDRLQLRVLPQLLRLVNGREAAAGMDAMMQLHRAQHLYEAVLDQLRWRVGRRLAAVAAAAAQVELCAQGFTLASYLERTKAKCNEDIERRGRRLEVIALAEAERERRVVRQRQLRVCESVRRRVAQRRAAALADTERAQRIVAERFFEVLEDLTRLANRRAVRAAVAAEPPRRARGAPMPLMMQTQIREHWTRKTARQLARERQQELVQRWRMYGVVQEIDRRFAVRAAVAMFDDARAERLHAQRFEPVMAALRSRFARRLAAKQTEDERTRRRVMPSEFAMKHTLRRCLQQMQFGSRRHQVAEAAEDLLCEHRHQHAMRDRVLPQLRSTLNRRRSSLLAAEAQGQLVANDVFQRLVRPELERVFTLRALKETMRNSWMEALLLPPPTPLPGLRLQKRQVCEAVRRRAVSKACREQLECEVSKRRYTEVVDAIEHLGRRRAAAAAEAQEQAERVHADRLRAVHHQLRGTIESLLTSLASASSRTEMQERFMAIPEDHRVRLAQVRVSVENMKK